MSKESLIEAEVRNNFSQAVTNREFSYEDMQAMLVTASQLMNSFEVTRMVAVTQKYKKFNEKA